VSNVRDDDRINDQVRDQVAVAAGAGIDFVAADQIGAAARHAGLSDADADAIVEDYENAAIQSLKVGLLAAGFLALGSLAFTADLPHRRREDDDEGEGEREVVDEEPVPA
jgi:hypothetical protein